MSALRPAKGTDAELRGQDQFVAKSVSWGGWDAWDERRRPLRGRWKDSRTLLEGYVDYAPSSENTATLD